MRLSGALSNQQALPKLEAAVRALVRCRRRTTSTMPERRALRLPMGAIQDAVLAVLAGAVEPMRPREVHAEVEQRLGRPTSQDTVSSFLSVAARRASLPVERVNYGRYVARSA